MASITLAYRVTQLTWAAWLGSWLLAALWSSKAARRSRSLSDLLYRALTGVGALLLFWYPRRGPAETMFWHPAAVAAWTCAALTIAGLATTWWARVTLGRLWSSAVTRKIDHRIVTAGPYRLVRHPIYFGLIVAVASTSMMQGTAGALIGAAFIALGFFVKARVEERFLKAELGEAEYNRYAQRVPMLLPLRLR